MEEKVVSSEVEGAWSGSGLWRGVAWPGAAGHAGRGGGLESGGAHRPRGVSSGFDYRGAAAR